MTDSFKLYDTVKKKNALKGNGKWALNISSYYTLHVYYIDELNIWISFIELLNRSLVSIDK